MKEFDFYIYIDYSEKLMGYLIIECKNKDVLLKKINGLKHFKDMRNKEQYLHKVKNIFKKNSIESLLYKSKIVYTRDTIIILEEVIFFIKKNRDFNIFISIDDKHHDSFVRLFKEFDNFDFIIIKESKLKIGTEEYQLSLIIDNLLNIERRKNDNN